MRRRSKKRESHLPSPDFFDLAGTDPELLNSGRIPDPQPGHTPLFRWLAKVFTAAEARLRATGDTALRNAIRFFWVLLAVIGAFLLVGPVINEPMSFDEVLDSASVDEVDWLASDTQLDYTVSRDGDGAFVAEVTEAYIANFVNGPESTVERVLITEFEGHDVEFALESATIDGADAKVDIDRKSTTTELHLTRSDGEAFEGDAEIEISYTLHHLVSSQTDESTGETVDLWSWPVLGATWPQGTMGIDVSLTLAPEVDDALIRNPQAYVGWLLLSGTEWLTPERESAAGVEYSFSNDDTLPPNPDVWIDASFEPGTFTQPSTTKLFWLQTWGPLIPLVLLTVLMLFAVAARRVVWSDSAGAPWYLPRNEPPEDMDHGLATRFMNRWRHTELVTVLADQHRGTHRSKSADGATAYESWLRSVAEVGKRAGRLGSVYAALKRTSRWGEQDSAVKAGLRWAPDSYVRDTFILAPIAVTFLQWGLLRQLSHHVILLVVWWPAVFVLISTVLAIITVAAVWRPRPLTKAGARAMQQLKGIDVWARATRLIDRGPITDPLLPYAMLFESPRRSGRAATEHAIQESGDRRIAKRWRTRNFISLPAIFAFIISIGLLAASIVTVSTTPAPYSNDLEHVTWGNDLPGTLYSQVKGFGIDAELSRGGDGQAQINVVEHLTVLFDESSSKVPQLAREWPAERLGQDLGFNLTSVQLDGKDAPFREISEPDTQSVVMHTQFREVMRGEHEMEIAYTLHSAAVDQADASGAIQEVRWAAWFDFWKDDYYTNPSNPFDGSAPVRPIRLRLTVAPGLVDEVKAGGWIDSDADLPRVPLENGNTFAPWVMETSHYLDTHERYEFELGSEKTSDDGSLIATLDVDEMTSRESETVGEGGPFEMRPEINAALTKYELGLNSDLGAVLRFAPGTFAHVDQGVASHSSSEYWRPYIVMMGLGGLIIVASLAVFAFTYRMRRRPGASLMLTSFVTLPLTLVAQCVLFCWTVMPMRGDSDAGKFGFAVGAVMFVGVIAQTVIVYRRGSINHTRGPADDRSNKTRNASGSKSKN